MLKVTLKFLIYCVAVTICGCNGQADRGALLAEQRQQDSLSEMRIDSAYAEIRKACDSLLVTQVPLWVDTLIADSTRRIKFGTNLSYLDSNTKVEKVIRQLLADCDSNLRKETYRKVRLLRQAMLKPRKAY